jgi:hypothetical protein
VRCDVEKRFPCVDPRGPEKRRDTMARGKDINVKAFCDDVYTELAGMRMKILTMMDELALTYGNENETLVRYQRHLSELAEQIEWKLQILSHACPYDWKGSIEKVETTVSVQQPDVKKGPEFSPGYVGG